MSTFTNTPIEPNLPTLACMAAAELDNIILNRKRKELEAIPLLINTLKRIEDFSVKSIDPSQVLIINRAISDSGITEFVRTTAQLAERTTEIRNNLNSILNKEKQNKKELEQLRSFCVELSKNASWYMRSMMEVDPQHPFRG